MTAASAAPADRPRWRSAIPALLVVLIAVAAVAVRVHFSGLAEMQMAQAAIQAGDEGEAEVHLRRAVRWYLPGNGVQDEAATAMESLATGQRRRGENASALRTFRDLRGSLYGSRWLVVPQRDRISRCDEAIASLMADEAVSGGKPASDRESLRSRYLSQLRSDPSPSAGWSAVMVLGFLAWAGSVFYFLLRAASRRSRIAAATTAAAGFAAWLAGMFQA